MQVSTSITFDAGLILDQRQEHDLPLRSNLPWAGVSSDSPSPTFSLGSAEEESMTDDDETGLNDAARGEREYVRERLLEELKREPTEAEMDAWLREQTEGY